MRKVLFTLFFLLININASFAAGFQILSFWNEKLDSPTELAIWYPSARVPREYNFNAFTLNVAQNAKIIEAKYPLIILSHDTLANQLAYHTIASQLGNNFIVVAPKFYADNINDMSLSLSFKNIIYRCTELSSVIDTLEQSKEFKDYIDFNKIYLVSFGTASLPSLISFGSGLSADNYDQFCDANASDPFCNNYNKKRFSEFITSASNWQKNNSISTLHENRLQALFLVSPLFSMFFTENDFANIAKPISIINTDLDKDFLSQKHAMNYKSMIKRASLITINGASFTSFFARCSDSLKAENFEICLKQDANIEIYQEELANIIKNSISPN